MFRSPLVRCQSGKGTKNTYHNTSQVDKQCVAMKFHSASFAVALAAAAAFSLTNAESPQCAASCPGSQSAWARPSDGTVSARATQIPAWNYAASMASSQWMLFPYGVQKQGVLSTQTAGEFITPRTVSQQFFIWSREILPEMSPVAGGADMWYTLSFRFMQNPTNTVRRAAA